MGRNIFGYKTTNQSLNIFLVYKEGNGTSWALHSCHFLRYIQLITDPYLGLLWLCRLGLLLLHNSQLCIIHRLHQWRNNITIQMDLRFVVVCSTKDSGHSLWHYGNFNLVFLQYGQQMTVGQHRPVYYMPTYPHVRQSSPLFLSTLSYVVLKKPWLELLWCVREN